MKLNYLNTTRNRKKRPERSLNNIINNMRNVVKELRQRLNLSQSKFAKVAGFNSIQQVSNLENDRQNVGLGLIKKMVDSLNESGHRATLTVSISVDDEDILLC